ncbi:uncharacterized protein PFLUO_LOCUS936 [Penicillium psychrofluorescens]|uniref:uncharacterized protein n=1 Tax=Penicillium psychrofluorescens TaxID=3158075 RepID=UPI003CCCE795
MAKVYITDHSSAVVRTHGWRTASNSAPYLLRHLKPNMRILDVGCGPGTISTDLAKYVPDGEVVGVEYVHDPLEGARQFAADAGVTNISFQVGDIHALKFPDDSFDVVHAHQVLQHIADPVQALREMRRVVKPGGIVAARDSATFDWYPENEGIVAWNHLIERTQRARGGNPHPGNMIHVWAAKAGFARQKIEKSTGSWCFSSDEERAYWGGSMAERAQSSGFATMAIQEGYASDQDLEKIASGWRSWAEDPDGWFGMLHGQILCWKE